MDVELREVRGFLAEHAPFAALPAPLLDELPARLLTRYYRRGSIIVDLGAANNSLFILRSGAVDIHDAAGELVERAETGTSFGTSSVRDRQPSRYRIVAIEDSLVLVMPGEIFSHLLSHQPAFAGFAPAAAPPRIRRPVAPVQAPASGSTVLQPRVADMLGREPVTGASTMSIQEAAALMTQHRVSALPIADDGRLVGIVTDRDLRSKVVVPGRDITEPVSAIMTAHPVTIGRTTLAFEAMLEMTTRGVHHLPVVDEGRLVGIVTSGDIMRLETASPVFIVGDVAKQRDVAGIAAVCARVPELVTRFVAQDASADEISRVVTAVADAVTRKLIALAEADLGPAPVPYCWLVLGSQARHEYGLGSDQDHALLLSDTATPEHDAWFAALAERVTAGLEQCGYRRCDGDVMATNPRWRQSLTGWGRSFAQWLTEPDAQSVLHAQIFFDARAVHGDASLLETLNEAVLAQTPSSQRFLGHLATQAAERQPPIGFFRGFVLEREGEHRSTFDIKAGGVHAVIELARVYALANGVAEVNTIERLRAVAGLGKLSAERVEDLIDAFEFISYVRLRHQARQRQRGEAPDNHVNPEELSSFEKRHLRDAFGIIRTMQQGLAYAYQTHLMS